MGAEVALQPDGAQREQADLLFAVPQLTAVAVCSSVCAHLADFAILSVLECCKQALDHGGELSRACERKGRGDTLTLSSPALSATTAEHCATEAMQCLDPSASATARMSNKSLRQRP